MALYSSYLFASSFGGHMCKMGIGEIRSTIEWWDWETPVDDIL